MARQMKSVFALVVLGGASSLLVSAGALGQQATQDPYASGGPPTGTPSPTRERPVTPVLAPSEHGGAPGGGVGAGAAAEQPRRRTGGSLFAASLAAQPDPTRLTIKNASPFAVPEQEPKTV